MSKWFLMAWLGCALFACQSPPAPIADTVYQGASVWRNGQFVRQDLAVRADRILGRFIKNDMTRTVDVSGAYITPALGNGHQHITNATQQNAWQFFNAGVYYVWNPNQYSSGLSEETRAYYARADTIEFKTSLGGITEPLSHPEPLYVENLGPFVYNGATYDDLYQKAFHYGRTRDEIVESLDRLARQGADFVKIYLVNSEDYIAPNADGSPNSMAGLNPQNVGFLVEEAHARDLPVVAHIESQTDFQVVVAAEVDYVGHLPGYYSVSEGECEAVILSEDDAANAAAAGVRVMPTYGLASANFTQKRIAEGPFTEDEEAALAAEEARTYSVQALNLKRLRAAGVQFVVGTDLFPGRVLEEPKRWIELGALTPKEALIAMFATGPTLFPGRSIGCLDAGCEADFLVLDGNPLEDLDAFSSIRFHIKSGTMLGVEPG